MSLAFLILLLVGYIGMTMYLANLAYIGKQASDYHRPQDDTVTIYDMEYRQQRNVVRWLLYAGVFIISTFAFYLLMLGFAATGVDPETGEPLTESLPQIGGASLIAGMIVSGATATLAYNAVATQGFRLFVQRMVNRTGEYSYNPDSIVHTTAIVFSLLILTAQVIQFIAIGGTEGLAQSYEENGVDPSLIVVQAILQIGAAFLGVGWAIRRDAVQALERLGLRMPTPDDWRYGVGGGLASFAALLAFGMVINTLLPGSLDGASAANQSIVNPLSTLPLALVFAICVAVGEEIFFRGALQPVFGNVIVSVFFALLHTQSLLSPAIFFLFAVSYLFGYIREKQSTTAAIIAHFIYNFIQLFLSLAAT